MPGDARPRPRQYRVGCFGTDDAEAKGPSVLHGAQDRASPNFAKLGLTSLGLEIGSLGDSLYSVLLLNAILGLDF
jgi:hypothetical protein